MDVVCHKKLEEIPVDVWDGLAAKNADASIFQSYGWHKAFIRAHGEGEGLCILGVYEAGVCLGIAPLMIDRRRASRVLHFIGDERADYCDLVYSAETKSIVRAVSEWLLKERALWDEVELDNVPSGSLSMALLRRMARRQGWQVFRSSRTPCPAMVLAGHPDFVEAALNKKRLKKNCQYFSGQGGFTVDHYKDAGVISGFLKDFFSQHIHRWSLRDERSLFVERPGRDFYRALLEEPSLAGRVILTRVAVAGEAVAYHFGFLDRGKLLLYKPSFEASLSRHTPGDVLLREVIVYARHHGLPEIDFTRGNESYKDRFANKVRYNCSWVITRDWPRYMILRVRCLVKASPVLRCCYELLRDIKECVAVFLNRKTMVARLRAESQNLSGHQQLYDSAEVVRQYQREAGLQKPEAEILQMFRRDIKGMRVLDIGMGMGRTSVYFGPVAREYLAFDFAPSMVSACRELNGDLVDPVNFLTGDARRMNFLDDHSFDFVLMSFNAIDNMNRLDRHRVLEEVRRVAKKGAWFCFSSHNQQSLSFRGVKSLGEFLRRTARMMLLFEANPDLASMALKDSAMVLDPGGRYQWPLMYITPQAQADQLKTLGFRDIRVFSIATGKEVRGVENWAEMREPWVYYLCRV